MLASSVCLNVRFGVFIDIELAIQCELHNLNLSMSRNLAGFQTHHR